MPKTSDVGALLDKHRWCYVIIETDYVKGAGYMVGIAIEDQAGYYPTGTEPWRWDGPISEVRETCAELNMERLGLSEDEAFKIVISTMFHRRHWHGGDK